MAAGLGRRARERNFPRVRVKGAPGVAASRQAAQSGRADRPELHLVQAPRAQVSARRAAVPRARRPSGKGTWRVPGDGERS